MQVLDHINFFFKIEISFSKEEWSIASLIYNAKLYLWYYLVEIPCKKIYAYFFSHNLSLKAAVFYKTDKML